MSLRTFGIVVIVLAATACSLGMGNWYVVGEGGFLFSSSGEYFDVDPHITSVTPMYGPGYSARGDFGTSAAYGAGVGCRPFPLLRTDFRVTDYPSIEFEGQTNFLPSSAPDEPTTGKTHATSLLFGAYVDPSDLPGAGWISRFSPYAGMGFGASINRQKPMTMYYPALTLPHYFTTPGGTNVSVAWKACAGFSFKLMPFCRLELEYRYTDLGETRTDQGDGIRYRPSTQETKIVPIGATYAKLRFHGLFVGARFSF